MTKYSVSQIAQLVDEWDITRRAVVTETTSAVTVARLSPEDAMSLIARIEELEWAYQATDRSQGVVHTDEICADVAPFVVTLQKPAAGGPLSAVTCAGLRQVFQRYELKGVCQTASAKIPFRTGEIEVIPWGEVSSFDPAPRAKSPLDLVREATERRVVPPSIDRWLVDGDITDELWNEPAFQAFAQVAAPALLRSIASEVTGQNSVTFSGPPKVVLEFNDEIVHRELESSGFRNLQAMNMWVYSDIRSAEQRHALLCAECGRGLPKNGRIAREIAESGRFFLEGARLAYQLSQADIIKEALKAQADLRKAVADDAAKAAESTRAVISAIAVATATSIGLIAARSVADTRPWLLTSVLLIVAGYLFCITVSGWQFLTLQRKVRDQWRKKFYFFIPDDEYQSLVTDPAHEAQKYYDFIGSFAVIVSAILITAAWVI